MSRIAAPMVGGMISSTVLTPAVITAIYALLTPWRIDRGLAARAARIANKVSTDAGLSRSSGVFWPGRIVRRRAGSSYSAVLAVESPPA